MPAKNNKALLREKSLAATVLFCILFVILLILTYFLISRIGEQRCLTRMEEGVNTVIDEVAQKLSRDSEILNIAANMLADEDDFDIETIRDTMTNLSPLLTTMQINVVLPDNTVITPRGNTLNNIGKIDFEKEAALNEHMSDRMVSVTDDSTMLLRHYVPVIKDGRTVALIYGVTFLDDLPDALNISNIYNASASVCIIDTKNGDMIMDTWHGELGNLNEITSYRTKGGESWLKKRQEILDRMTGHVIVMSDATKEWSYLYYAPIDVNQWTIMVSVPVKEAFAQLFAIQRVCYVAGAIALVMLILYYLLMRKNAISVVNRAVETAVLEEKLQKAEAAERAKTMFLSNMSHDIRTPMNAIIGFTTLAQANIDNKARVQEYLSKIMSSGTHLLSLINDILDMSRIESGRLNIEEKECTISDIFRDMRNILQTQMQAKQLSFYMDTIDVTDEDICCDKLHLNQVLLNLLSNAIKFTPSGGSVFLTVRQNPSTAPGYGDYEIRVRDTGIGMSEEFVQHVFEPFERERTSTDSGIQGTGLGMAITKSIIDAMGGTIEVKTEQGKGTEYIIKLKLRLQSEHKNIENSPELSGLRALVVDDSFNTCDSVTKMLTQLGMHVEWTLRGRDAILYARQSIEMKDEFKVYIVDWSLPDLNGIEVVRQLRAVVGQNVPIIILTAYDWSIFESDARDAGATAFCNKPIFASELRSALINAISGKSSKAPGSEGLLPDPDAELKGKRLLLVEDNELNREIAQEILEESGFIVETAHDGAEAVEKVKKSPHGYYSLVLMDIQMPVMNGYEATRAIRALEDRVLAGIPIVAMTANAFEEDRRTALESGMNAHVSKPIDVQKLMGVLHSLLKQVP